METQVSEKFFSSIKEKLPERYVRIVAAEMAHALGHGGIKLVADTSQISRSTIIRGIKQRDLPEYQNVSPNAQRRPGGGRKNVLEKQPEIMQALENLVSPYTRGDPMRPLRWTTKSLRKLSHELESMSFKVSYVTVGELLEQAGYTLQSCKKSLEGVNDPDRNAQFEHINSTSLAFFEESQPVISVDTKKKELVGNFKNGGREYQPKSKPVLVNTYDFIDDATGKAVPYGIYDVSANQGFVCVGTNSDTAEFAVNSIRNWWNAMGSETYQNAHSLYITADGGGSNGSRNRLWKREIQKFATDYNINVYVSHFPPATSKWNKIEHRLFSAITMNWRGRPLDSFETIVSLIANTTNNNGLKVRCMLDEGEYATGIKVGDDELEKLNILRHSFRPDWNYVIKPQ